VKRGIVIDLKRQRLWALDEGIVCRAAAVSTSAQGSGEQQGSGCTPRGQHEVCARIGDRCQINTVFVGRQATGEIYTPELGRAHPERDWILTRILWLSGLEAGRNQCGELDSRQRYIYIHGCPDESPIGVAVSHGCIRMRNRELVELFDWALVGERVLITEDIDAVEDPDIRGAVVRWEATG